MAAAAGAHSFAAPRSMKLPPYLISRRLPQRGLSAKIGSLTMILQRSPLVQLLPEARVISSSGFSEALRWTVAAISGFGAFDAVSGATTVSQLTPVQNSSTVPATGGSSLSFVFSIVGAGGHTPSVFQVVGALPAGLTQAGLRNSRTDAITGIPVQTGAFPVTIIAWEGSGYTGRSTRANFTISVANPPAPVITASPAGGSFQPGAFVRLQAAQNHGFTFTWKKDGEMIPPGNTTFIEAVTPRKFLVPGTDPGTAWRTGEPFTDTPWTAVSGGIGYDTNPSGVNYLPHIASGGNLQSRMSGLRASAFVRIPFTLTGSAPVSTLQLRTQCDDGFVAWLNGTQVAALNKPSSLLWNSSAAGTNPDAAAVTWTSWNLNAFTHLLRSGENLLAVQLMNESVSSSDLLFNCELTGGIDDTNTRTLVIPAVQAADAGSYTVTVTNPAGSATCAPAFIVLPPAIESQPQSTAVAPGAAARLQVQSAVSPPWSFQWFLGESGDTSRPVEGASGAIYETPALTETSRYWVRVSNAAGTVDSATAVVTIADPLVAWRMAHFTEEEVSDPAISGPDADPDGDGISNQREYVFGTAPRSGQEPPALHLQRSARDVILTFTASAAAGSGYGGRSRHFAVETTDNLSAGGWTEVPGLSDVTGNNQAVTHALEAGPAPQFYRLRVWLSP
jgi:hypothetical protein